MRVQTAAGLRFTTIWYVVGVVFTIVSLLRHGDWFSLTMGVSFLCMATTMGLVTYHDARKEWRRTRT